MSIAHDAYTALLSELTTRKNEKEIWWDDEEGNKVTVELLDAKKESYIVRSYFENGQLEYEDNYLKGKLYGLCKDYYENGQLIFEYNYLKDKYHGLCKDYYENGKLSCEYNYFKGQLHGLCKSYDKNGQLEYEYNYINGKLQRKETQ